MTSKGIIYVATGVRYRDEAITSAQSVKRCMPNMHITIFTDSRQFDNPCFDTVQLVNNPCYSYIDKIGPLKHSPYDRTLFLDSDTFVCCSCEEIFELLDRFDIATTHDTWRLGHPVSDCTDAFTELNTGVILYKRSPVVHEFFDQWLSFYRTQLEKETPAPPHDQSSFRKVIYDSRLSLYILSSEYNYTLWFPGFAGAGSNVKIIHGRTGRLAQSGTKINESTEARVFIPSIDFFKQPSFNSLSSGDQRIMRLMNRLATGLRKVSRAW